VLADDFRVVRTSRRPERAAQQLGGNDWIRFETAERPTVERALEGIDIVVYLVHGMAGGEDYDARERESAFILREAAERAGVSRIVYLGGVEPRGVPSKHLQSRLQTGRILREGAVPTWELRAGMIVGEGSESWQICRDLALRLPAMVLPRWVRYRSQPVAIDDVLVALRAAVVSSDSGHQLFDLPGPTTLRGDEILRIISGLRGMRPLTLPVPVLSPRLSSHWLRFVSGTDMSIARELVQGMTGDLISTQPSLFDHLGVTPTPFEAAAERALAEHSPSRRARIVEDMAARVALAAR
jgi:uncharacterized protein YbjT (DUF2867 family)